jgi:Polyketide cyclase / dehydrase and lipid transport
MTGREKENIMASIYKEISLDSRPEEVWAALRDFGAVHRRVAPGFVTDCRLDGDSRIVTFANGNVAQELLVTIDEARMRLVYAVVSPRVKQHSASIQVVADGQDRCRVTWVADVLPNEIGPYIDAQMDLGALAMQKAFRRSAA